MKGKLLDFSIQTNSGVISAENQQRYVFSGEAWKEQQAPLRGMLVDFEIDASGKAIDIYVESVEAVVTTPSSQLEAHPSTQPTLSEVQPVSPAVDTTTFETEDHESQQLESESQYSMMDWVKKCLIKFVDIKGRARRKEFWYFQLWITILSFIAILLGDVFNWGENLFWMVALSTALPNVAVNIRRLHDVNRSGWFILLSCIPIIGPLALIFLFYIREGNASTNQFGPVSK